MRKDTNYIEIQTIYSLLQGEKKIVVTNLHGLIKLEFPKHIWECSTFTLRKGTCIEIKDLLDRLVRIGYEPVYTITKTGEFSRRGDIIDIFNAIDQNPIRIDFFDTQIEQMHHFDLVSFERLEEVKINITGASVPLYDIF